ncbi:MAG: hypothetical protein CMJ81_14630 [Planctomycetaceae bacterium]|nr:hypothetical protein [Planctomycetaceae bacterium]MBP60886.1 hypothetical protein [Planctomycetaceae bacterium]
MRSWTKLGVTVLLLSVTTSSTVDSTPPSRTRTQTETFDRDPQWDGHNNRQTPHDPPTVTRDFGYSRTKHTGNHAGEIGGRVSASLRPAWYGKVIDQKSLDDALSASGTLCVLDAQSITGWQTSANIFVGWFTANDRDLIWRPRNFIGFRLQSSNEPDGCVVELSYGTSEWQAGGAFVNAVGGVQQENVRDLETDQMLRIPPDGSTHRWSFRYDPAGAGEMVFTFDGNETRLKLGDEHRKIGATFDRFGIFPSRIPGRHIVAYFGDLMIAGKAEDLSKEPSWEGVGNRERFQDSAQYAYNNFGFSKTSHAGGTPGELGGRFFSCDPDEDQFKAYYGAPVGKLTLENRLTASGKFIAREHCIDATFALGWFNSRKQDWPIENFVGVYFDSYSKEGRIIEPLYGTSDGTNQRGGGYVTFEPGRPYTWTLDYQPDGASGRGEITFTIGAQRVTKTLDEGEKDRGALFDRFGVFNMQWANSKWCDVYLDDLAYTVSTN